MSESELYDNEAVLLPLITEGDEAAFRRLYFLYAPRLRAYISKFVKNSIDQEEIIQECFVQVWLSRDKLTDVTFFQAWMYKLTANNCMKYLRKVQKNAQKLAGYQQQLPEEAISEFQIDTLQLHELRKLALEAIASMNATRQHIYRLSREEGCKPAEIASRLQIPLSTVKNNLSLANKEIRAHLASAGYSIPSFLWLLIIIF